MKYRRLGKTGLEVFFRKKCSLTSSNEISPRCYTSLHHLENISIKITVIFICSETHLFYMDLLEGRLLAHRFILLVV